MSIGIIADSCCDLDRKMKEMLHADLIPLKITVGGQVFTDDRDIDLAALRAAIKQSKTAATTACPSPEEYAEAMRKYDSCMVITLSSKLSGSYNSAMVAKGLVEEECPQKKIHICDSKSASSGEVQIALMIRELDGRGLSFETIVELVEENISKTRTFFILEDLSTLMKNGRLNKVVGTVATMLSLRPIMGENGAGEIAMVDKVRGTQKALVRLTEIIAERTLTCGSKSVRLVLSHCNAEECGKGLRDMILRQCPAIGEVLLVATKGLSTVYANEGGVIVAFREA